MKLFIAIINIFHLNIFTISASSTPVLNTLKKDLVLFQEDSSSSITTPQGIYFKLLIFYHLHIIFYVTRHNENIFQLLLFISGNETTKMLNSESISNCGGIFVTPFHILTTSNCAILLKKKKLKPISIQLLPNALSSIDTKTRTQHFNISEIYLHPSHTKRKHVSTKNVQGQMSADADKGIALIKISSSKNGKSYPNRMKSTEILSMPNERRIRQIKTRGGKITTFRHLLPNVMDQRHQLSEIINVEDCDLNITNGAINSIFLCKNQTKTAFSNDTINKNDIILQGFPMFLIYPRSRSRQSTALIGCKTSKVT